MFKEILIGGTILLFSGYSFYKHKLDNIECVSYVINNEKIPTEFNEFKIVQISDLHNRNFGINNNIF